MSDIRKTVGDLTDRGTFDGTEQMEVFPTSLGVSRKKKVGTAAERDVATNSSDVTAGRLLSIGGNGWHTGNLPYETGIFTPTFLPQTGTFTTMTYGTQGGRYTRIGNRYLVDIILTTNNVDVTGASGNLTIQQPFVNATGLISVAVTIGDFSHWGTAFATTPRAWINQGQTIIQLHHGETNVGRTTVSVSNLKTGAFTNGNIIALSYVLTV